MSTLSTMRRLRRASALLALAGMASAAFAQPANPQGPPGSAPPSGGATPPGGPGGPPPGGGPSGGGPAGGGLMPPPNAPLTPAEKLADSLPAPSPGGMMPIPDLAPDEPLPTANPRDFQGTWYHNQNLDFRMQKDMYGKPVPYTMAGAKVLERRVMSLKNGKPFINASAKCRPPGAQWQHDLNMPFQIFQSPKTVQFVFEEYHGRWNIAFDPALLPPGKEYMGRSVARWDGDTLVVTTDGFKQDLWLDVDGTPFSKDGKLVQRIRKIDNGDRHPLLEMITTVYDPINYARPWSVVRTFAWKPQLTLFNEYNCEEQVGDPSGATDSGLVAETTK